MSDETVLTKEIAEQFLAGEDSVDIWTFTAMEDGAAESLGKHEGETYAICKADLLLEGEGEAADNIISGPEHSTLSNDA